MNDFDEIGMFFVDGEDFWDYFNKFIKYAYPHQIEKQLIVNCRKSVQYPYVKENIKFISLPDDYACLKGITGKRIIIFMDNTDVEDLNELLLRNRYNKLIFVKG